jgi:hypothetical protein
MPLALPAPVEAALKLASRAPSAHNTQPWQVDLQGDRLQVRADPGRWLRHGDPLRRDLQLSLGAFVEALQLSLGGQGLGYDRDAPDRGAFATLRPTAAGAKPDRLALSLLRRRQTSRLGYSPRPPEREPLEALVAAARAAGLELHLVPRGSGERAELDRLCWAAARESWLDARAVAELRGWIRFDPEGTLKPADGLSTHCLALGPAETAAMLLLLRPGFWRAAKAIYAAPVLAGRLARQEVGPVEAAPVLGVLVAPGPAGEAGGGLLRIWLEATRLGLALAPNSAVLDRRGWELGRWLGVAPGRLVSVFRLGRSAPPPWSQRRPVASFTASGIGLA